MSDSSRASASPASSASDGVLLSMFLMTDLQPGTGTGSGAIDRTVYRDPVTQELGVRDTQQIGALRHSEYLRRKEGYSDVFVEEGAARRRPLTLFDAPVAFLHVSSFVGQSALVTSPSVLARIARTIKAAGLEIPAVLKHDWSALLSQAGGDRVLTSALPGGALSPVEYRASDGTQRVQLGTRERFLRLRSAPSLELVRLGRWLSKCVLGSAATELPEDARVLEHHLVLVGNDVLVHDLRHPKVFSRNKVDDDGLRPTKIWNEEVIPSASVILTVARSLDGEVVRAADGAQVSAVSWLQESIGDGTIIGLGARQSGSLGQLLVRTFQSNAQFDDGDMESLALAEGQRAPGGTALELQSAPPSTTLVFRASDYQRMLTAFAFLAVRDVVSGDLHPKVDLADYHRVVDEALSLFHCSGEVQMLGELSARIWATPQAPPADFPSLRVWYDAARWLSALSGVPEVRRDWVSSTLASEPWLVSRLVPKESAEDGSTSVSNAQRWTATADVLNVLVALKEECAARAAVSTNEAA